MTISRQRKKERLRGINIGRLLELINTMRTFLRLSTGLVGIISSASSSLLSPKEGNNDRNDKSKKDMITKNQGRGGVMISARRGAEILQLALLSLYQLYENIGFLTDQGVLLLPSTSSSSSSSLSGTDANDENDKINKIANAVKNHYLISSRAWMGSVVFSIFSTLLATSDTTTTATTTAATTKQKQHQHQHQHQGEEYLWWKSLVVPVGISLPLSAHASFEKGLLADEVVALMGLVVAGMGLRKGWVDTEKEEKEEEGKEKGRGGGGGGVKGREDEEREGEGKEE